MNRTLRAALAATLTVLLAVPSMVALAQTTDPAQLTASTWSLTSIDGEVVPVDAGISAAFGTEGQVSGSGGCNQYTGTYSVDGDILIVGPLAATRIACEADIAARENAYLTALEAATTWSVTDSDLTITTASGGTLVFGVPGDLVGDWTLVSIDGLAIPAELSATASFSEDGRISGSAGCNSYSGTYVVEGAAISVGPLAATLKLCEPTFMDVETPFLDALQTASGWSAVGSGLTIFSGSGAVLQFTASGTILTPTSLGDAAWTLSFLDGTAVAGDPAVTASFAPDGRLSGSAGCNDYFGSWSSGGSALTVSGLAATRKACDPFEVMSLESSFLAAIEASTTWSIAGSQLTILTASDDELVFTATGPGPGPGPSAAPSAAPSAPPSVAPSAGPTAPEGIVGPVWTAVTLAGTDLELYQSFIDIEITIQFFDDGTFTGNGGCNDYSSTYVIDGESLSIGTVDAASFDCDVNIRSLEQVYFQILSYLDTVRLDDGQLVLESALSPSTLSVVFEEQ